ncbi:hypothetical protein FJ366_03695 [Candidatus Dependentiae bacterium]|nr:hypothetical protein [Candidatus Dependentiae bacterium]
MSFSFLKKLFNASYLLCFVFSISFSFLIGADGSTSLKPPLVFDSRDKYMIGRLGGFLAKDEKTVSAIASYYKQLHKLSVKIDTIKTTRGYVPSESNSVAVDPLDEAAHCDRVMTKFQNKVPKDLLLKLHGGLKFIPGAKNILLKVVDHEVDGHRPCNSKLREFFEHPIDKIELWFKSFKKLDEVAFFFKELKALFVGLKRHVPGGKELFAELHHVDPVDAVNHQPEERIPDVEK